MQFGSQPFASGHGFQRLRALGGHLVRYDLAGLERAARARRRWLTAMLVPYTIAGTIGLPWLLFGIAVDHVARVAVAVAAAALVTGILKRVWGRRRPDVVPRLVRRQRTTSFPSGHSATAVAAACALAVTAPALAPVWFGMAAVMAASRVYVGVHWPTDVMAGAALGAMVVMVPVAALVVA